MKARLARVAEVRSALEEATAAAAILEPVAMRKLRQEAKKVRRLCRARHHLLRGLNCFVG